MSDTAREAATPGERSGEEIVSWMDGSTRHVLLNRPDRRNAVSADVLLDLTDVLDRAGTDPEVRAICVSGTGSVFCAGADLDTRDEPGGPPSPATIDAANRAVRAVVHSPKVVVTAVQGPAVGVGVALALAADLTIMRSDAYLLLAFTKIGLMPDGGATALIAASAGRATAQRLALLAEPMSAHEAVGAGLVAALHDEDSFEQRVAATLAALAAGPCRALAATKRVINDASLTALDTSFAAERAGQLELLAGADFAEGVAAFEQRRKPVFATPA